MTIETTHRIARLLDAINHFAGGNKSRFGREVGYGDGAFVRHMSSGSRPITEKTIAKIEERYQCPGWFAAPSDTVVDTPAGKVGILDDGAGLRVPVLAHTSGVKNIIVGPVNLSPAWVTQQDQPVISGRSACPHSTRRRHDSDDP